MRIIKVLSVACVTASLLVASPAQAKTCKDMVTAKARSASSQISDASRMRRARDRAIANWSARARDTYGWAYRFWRRGAERKVECGGGDSARHCTATAKPCRLL